MSWAYGDFYVSTSSPLSGRRVSRHIRADGVDSIMIGLLLGDESLPIATISLKCGLLDTGNFSRRFRQRFGYSPTTLRANRKSGPSAGAKNG